MKAGCKGRAAKTGPGKEKEETLVILSIKSQRKPVPMGTCWVLGIGHWVLEGRVMCAFLLPVCFFFIRYCQESADKRRQQWMIHEQPDGEGVVGSRSGAAAKIQNARNPEIPEMPEWVERKKGRKSQIQNQRRVWYVPTLARCWLRIIIIATHLPQARAKKVPENIVFFPSSSASARLELHQKVGFASSSFHASVVHTPLPPSAPPPPCPTWKNGC